MHNSMSGDLYISTNVADRIRMRAKERGVVVKNMLTDLSLGVNTLSNLRQGSMLISDTLARIADYLDCSMDYLMGRTEKPEINK